MTMTQENDREFDEALRKLLQDRLDSVNVSSTFQAKVLETIHERHVKHEYPHRFNGKNRRLRTLLWQSVAAVMVVAMIAFADYSLSKNAPGNGQFHSTNLINGTNMATSGVMMNADSTSAAGTSSHSVGTIETQAVVFGQFAAINTVNLQLVSGVTGDIQSKLKGQAQNSLPQMADRISSLSRQRFTVRCQLYNSSNTSITGKDLQGMLFILNRPGQLTPSKESDWEYFVNGPNQVIPAHHSVTWSFSPNPAPPYTSLDHRYVHIVWLTNQNVAGAPSLVIHPLPIQLKQDRMIVYKEVSPQIQFLRIQATVKNQGSTPLPLSSLLGMLFFKTDPKASLLSSATYKYFDDVLPLGKSYQSIMPGQTGQVQFEIVGVPGMNMTKLPFTLLVVKRSDIGA